MILYLTIGSLFLLFIIFLSIPVSVRVESSPLCDISWLFLKVHISYGGGNVDTEFLLFNKKPGFFAKKKPSREKEKPEKKRKKKEKKQKKIKWNKDRVFEVAGDSAVKKTLLVASRFLVRCFKSVRISFLNCNIGLKDYYWQGILFGLIGAVPKTKNLRIKGNFQETNDFIVIMKVSLWKVVSAILIFLLSFPYIKAIRLYRKIKTWQE